MKISRRCRQCTTIFKRCNRIPARLLTKPLRAFGPVSFEASAALFRFPARLPSANDKRWKTRDGPAQGRPAKSMSMTEGEKTCAKKVRYYTRDNARKAKRKMRKRYGWTSHIYPCKLCRGYHLSSLTRTDLRMKQLNKKLYEQPTTNSQRRGNSDEESESYED